MLTGFLGCSRLQVLKNSNIWSIWSLPDHINIWNIRRFTLLLLLAFIFFLDCLSVLSWQLEVFKLFFSYFLDSVPIFPRQLKKIRLTNWSLEDTIDCQSISLTRQFCDSWHVWIFDGMLKDTFCLIRYSYCSLKDALGTLYLCKWRWWGHSLKLWPLLTCSILCFCHRAGLS